MFLCLYRPRNEMVFVFRRKMYVGGDLWKWIKEEGTKALLTMGPALASGPAPKLGWVAQGRVQLSQGVSGDGEGQPASLGVFFHRRGEKNTFSPQKDVMGILLLFLR